MWSIGAGSWLCSVVLTILCHGESIPTFSWTTSTLFAHFLSAQPSRFLRCILSFLCPRSDILLPWTLFSKDQFTVYIIWIFLDPHKLCSPCHSCVDVVEYSAVIILGVDPVEVEGETIPRLRIYEDCECIAMSQTLLNLPDLSVASLNSAKFDLCLGACKEIVLNNARKFNQTTDQKHLLVWLFPKCLKQLLLLLRVFFGELALDNILNENINRRDLVAELATERTFSLSLECVFNALQTNSMACDKGGLYHSWG